MKYVITILMTMGFIMCAGQPDIDYDVIKAVKLPLPDIDSEISVSMALLNRQSVRNYIDKSLTMNEVSQLLWAGYGINRKNTNIPQLRGGFRTAPSAGALYPLELYLVVFNVDGLDEGLYHYNAAEHNLELLKKGNLKSKLFEAAMGQNAVKRSAACIVYSAVYSRTIAKYSDRGRQRYVPMDLGHSGQNVYLQAVGLNIGTVAIGAFNDELLADVISMSESETPLYIMPLGKVEDDFYSRRE
ncbi:MAG: SagB/ThcOx family dehydrogenase [candidate division WOR-3 bacterium]|nr:SagB/ThcOx family dehydrogenase [candidate division WOR-3 bacterium]